MFLVFRYLRHLDGDRQPSYPWEMPKRLSRDESQARTRERLIDAATRLFLRDGFQVTKVDDIAEAAGYSRGAVYSNFANKEEIGLAVLDSHLVTQFHGVAGALSSGTLHERLGALSQWMTGALGNGDWALLKVEVALHVRQNPDLQAHLTARDGAARQTITELIDQVCVETDTALPVASETLAGAILAMASGLAVERLIDPAGSSAWAVDLVAAAQRLLEPNSANR